MDWPAGALLAQANGSGSDASYWICAQPVHLAVDRDSLVLQPPSQLRLSDQESRTLFQALSKHFASEHLEMRHIATGNWCIGVAHPQKLSTTEIALAQGRSVDGLLPAADDAQRWQRRVMEAQMILHDHPVNAAREHRGDVPVNSLWIWGGGTVPAVDRCFDTMCVVDPLLRALAVLSHAQLMEVPANASTLPADGNNLVEFDLLGYDNSSAALAALETGWLFPAWQALATGRLDELTLALPHGDTIIVSRCGRKERRRFWKRRQLLSRFLSQFPEHRVASCQAIR